MGRLLCRRALFAFPLCGEVLVGESHGGDGGDAEYTAEVEQEVERVAALPSYRSTMSEYLEHCVTHSPYRPWCRHCAEGRGQEFGHYKRRGHDLNKIPVVAFDYAGLTDKGDWISKLEIDENDDTIARVLIVAICTPDDAASVVRAHVVRTT